VNSSASYVNDRSFYRTISRYDQPHIVRAVLTYAPPVKFQRSSLGGKFADAALGGWTIAGYYTYESGTPLSITQANGRPFRIANEVIDGPIESRLGDKRDAQGRVLNPYFDINAFQPLASQYVISPDPPYLAELRAPAGHTLNAFLYKSFRILERLRLEVNMQAESVTNTPNFNSPGTNMSTLATFGVISTAGGGNRQMQAGMRLVF
jgi:hypothetical protein